MESNTIQGLTIESIKGLLESGDFVGFKRHSENENFEAKQKHPYDLDSIMGIVSLASDVATLANGVGGYIVCGLINEKEQELQQDIVKDLDLVSEIEFYNQDRIKGILKDSIYPKFDVEIKWYPSKEDPELGLGVIFVPAQEESKKYFIVRVAEVEGNILKRNFVGIPIRKGAEPIWLSVDEIYKLTKRAPTNLQQFHDSLSNQIAEIKEVVTSNIPTISPADDLNKKIEEVLDVH